MAVAVSLSAASFLSSILHYIPAKSRGRSEMMVGVHYLENDVCTRTCDMSTPPAEIKCLFFSEFDPIAGPKISCQVPEDFPLGNKFDAVHDLIITKPQLNDRLISVEVAGYKFIGCPKCIEDNKYDRNAFMFNFVFVFDSTIDTSPYEAVVLKIGNAFKSYEMESSFLSSENSCRNLLEILSNVRRYLNSCGFCTIKIDETNRLHLKITPTLDEPPAVHDYHVPIFTCTKEDIETVTWDLTIEQILTYINSFNHVKKIALESEVDISVVKVCIQHLVLYGFIKLISIFQYSNVYVPLPKLQELLTDSQLQQECLEYVAIPGSDPSISDVFRLYCDLEAGLNVRDLCTRTDLGNMGVDERMLIQYGLMRGLIRHLQRYPVLVEPTCTSEDEPLELSPELEQLHEQCFLDGSHCFDEICCALNISSQKLEDWIDSSANVLVCWK